MTCVDIALCCLIYTIVACLLLPVILAILDCLKHIFKTKKDFTDLEELRKSIMKELERVNNKEG
jgi:hypothetical protein